MIIFHIGLSTNIWLQTPFFDSNQACLQFHYVDRRVLARTRGPSDSWVVWTHGSSGLVGPTPTIWFVHFVDLLCISFGKKQITPIVVIPKILAQLSSKDGRQIRFWNLTIHFSKTIMMSWLSDETDFFHGLSNTEEKNLRNEMNGSNHLRGAMSLLAALPWAHGIQMKILFTRT